RKPGLSPIADVRELVQAIEPYVGSDPHDVLRELMSRLRQTEDVNGLPERPSSLSTISTSEPAAVSATMGRDIEPAIEVDSPVPSSRHRPGRGSLELG